MIITILKILGIILLVLLLIILLLLVLLLFLPFKYYAHGKKNPEEVYFRAKISWLMGFIRARIDYIEDELTYNAHVLWVKVYDSEGDESDLESDNEKPKSEVYKASADDTAENSQPENSLTKEVQLETNQSETNQSEAKRSKDIPPEDIVSEQDTVQRTSAETNKESSCDEGDDKKSLSKQAEDFNEQLNDKITDVKDKINYIQEKLDILSSPKGQRVLKRLFQDIGKLLKHMSPKKFKLDVIAGTGAGDTTGQLLCMYSMAYPWLPKGVNFEPDFENERFEGALDMKGTLQLFYLLKILVGIALDKEVMQIKDELGF